MVATVSHWPLMGGRSVIVELEEKPPPVVAEELDEDEEPSPVVVVEELNEEPPPTVVELVKAPPVVVELDERPPPVAVELVEESPPVVVVVVELTRELVPPLTGHALLVRFVDGDDDGHVAFAAADMAHCRYKAVLVVQERQGHAATSAQAVLKSALQPSAAEFVALPGAELPPPAAVALVTHA